MQKLVGDCLKFFCRKSCGKLGENFASSFGTHKTKAPKVGKVFADFFVREFVAQSAQLRSAGFKPG